MDEKIKRSGLLRTFRTTSTMDKERLFFRNDEDRMYEGVWKKMYCGLMVEKDPIWIDKGSLCNDDIL